MHKEILYFTKDKLVSQDRSQSKGNIISEHSPPFNISSQTHCQSHMDFLLLSVKLVPAGLTQKKLFLHPYLAMPFA